MTAVIRWGIIGTGTIAKKFATALQTLPDAKLFAVGSRTQAGADQFGDALDVPRRYGSYDQLTQDAELDAVYVATPHSCHKENALSALAANKPVLVEKPFTINAAEAEAIIEGGRRRKLLVMEAMWSRYLPSYVKLRQLLAEGIIGQPRLLLADFGFKVGPATNPRLLDPDLGGGALLDMGVYPLSLASMVFRTPTQINGSATIGASGVDEQSGAILRHQRGELAIISCSLQANTAMEIVLRGTGGSIRIHAPAWRSTSLTLSRDGKPDERLDLPFPGNGYQFEAIEFMNCLRHGKPESPIMPLNETLSIMKTMDELRRCFGLRYPTEK
jgi:predicted dehydrogenase